MAFENLTLDFFNPSLKTGDYDQLNEDTVTVSVPKILNKPSRHKSQHSTST